MKKVYLLLILLFFLPLFNFAQKKQTYKSNGTTYYSNETYSTTGQPKVKRSSTAKKEFLESKGYDKVPVGYQVDHKIPLSKGGSDKPENMQLISKEDHKIKTANERKTNSNSTYSNPTYNSNSSYSTPSYNTTSTNNTNSSRTVYTGSKGGRFYYNSNGNKTYIRKK